jgi:hypothetical protein
MSAVPVQSVWSFGTSSPALMPAHHHPLVVVAAAALLLPLWPAAAAAVDGSDQTGRDLSRNLAPYWDLHIATNDVPGNVLKW